MSSKPNRRAKRAAPPPAASPGDSLIEIAEEAEPLPEQLERMRAPAPADRDSEFVRLRQDEEGRWKWRVHAVGSGEPLREGKKAYPRREEALRAGMRYCDGVTWDFEPRGVL